MAKFIEITEASKNSVSHSADQTKLLNVGKITEITDDATPLSTGSQIESQPQSFNGVPDIRLVDETQSALNTSIGSATAAPPTVLLSVVAEGENYPSPGFTSSNVVFNSHDIVEVQDYIGTGSGDGLKTIDIVSSVTTNTTDGTDATYAGTSLTGGSGSGAVATVVVAGNAVTAVTVTTAGVGYKAGDVLTVSKVVIGGTKDVKITLDSSDIEDNYSVIRLHQYRNSIQTNYVVDKTYAALKTLLNA